MSSKIIYKSDSKCISRVLINCFCFLLFFNFIFSAFSINRNLNIKFNTVNENEKKLRTKSENILLNNNV